MLDKGVIRARIEDCHRGLGPNPEDPLNAHEAGECLLWNHYGEPYNLRAFEEHKNANLFTFKSGRTAQVRVTGRRVPGAELHLILDRDVPLKGDYYIFILHELKTGEIFFEGYATKEEFRTHAKWDGKKAMWKYFKPLHSIEELDAQEA